MRIAFALMMCMVATTAFADLDDDTPIPNCYSTPATSQVDAGVGVPLILPGAALVTSTLCRSVVILLNNTPPKVGRGVEVVSDEYTNTVRIRDTLPGASIASTLTMQDGEGCEQCMVC
jgi:hypothetical protein